MSKPLKPKKKSYPKKPEVRSCYYCGSEKIERLSVGNVNILRCKNCGETQD